MPRPEGLRVRDKRRVLSMQVDKTPARKSVESFAGWTRTKWSDNTEQVIHGNERRYSIERVIDDPVRDKYHIVDRGESDDDTHAWTVCAPIVSGPFEALDAAKAALLVFLSARGRQ